MQFEEVRYIDGLAVSKGTSIAFSPEYSGTNRGPTYATSCIFVSVVLQEVPPLSECRFSACLVDPKVYYKKSSKVKVLSII